MESCIGVPSIVLQKEHNDKPTFQNLRSILLTLSVQEKLKNTIFEIPIIPQILNINN